MLYKVKIWGNDLNCDICSSNQWYESTLKTEFLREDNTSEFSEEVRYMYECSKCGNCKIFGMVSSEKDQDEVNISTTLIDNERKR